MAPHTPDSAAQGPHDAAARRAAGLDHLAHRPGSGSDPAGSGAVSGAEGNPAAPGDVEAIHDDRPGAADEAEAPADPGDRSGEG